ncbi:MAG: repair protein RecN [Clostridia bacterium]|jgi:DNA repair protein RecN (Recombination protein N)|nr:repair protein RecN [Clostridia bacterium]
MILEINIRNFIIIEQETINFTAGLNIITGETGSGKSLIIDALQAITGGRFSKDDIRHGAEKAIISALFAFEHNSELEALLEEYGLEKEADNTLLISREVSTAGRSGYRVNGQTVTLTMLKAIAQCLVDIVGQNEHQLLFNANKHIEFVDSFGEQDIELIKSHLKSVTESLKSIEARYKEICGSSSERERKLDLFKFQIEEIESAALKPEEDEQLKAKRLLLINSEKLYKNMTQVYDNIFNNDPAASCAVDVLEDSAHRLKELEHIDNRLQDFVDVIEAALYQLEDIRSDIRDYKDSIEFNDDEINFIEERLDLISKLKRKYGSSIEDIIAFKDAASKDYEILLNSEKFASELEKEISSLRLKYNEQANKLSAMREKLSRKLEKLVEKELQDLNMEGSEFQVNIKKDEAIISSKGIDRIEFLLSPNPGEPPKQLSKIASGGEMSRVMLAIKNTITKAEKIPSIVFDEVDAGIGGLTATVVGQKIKKISTNSQIICITHLAQIACFADNHIYISKIINNHKTFTKIKTLDMLERTEEVARMLGGSPKDETSMAHARRLITSSN